MSPSPLSPIISDATVKGAVLVFRDITERKEFEEQLARHAFHDALTGLPNRRLFLDHLDHALRRSTRNDEQHAVLFCRRRPVQDHQRQLGPQRRRSAANGHSRQAARAAIRPGATCWRRFGGDEFTLLLEGVATPEDSIACAQRIMDRMRRAPITLPDGHEIVATVSIGIKLHLQRQVT